MVEDAKDRSLNLLIQQGNVNDLHREIYVEPIVFERDYITPPTGLGLGIELHTEVVQRQLCPD